MNFLEFLIIIIIILLIFVFLKNNNEQFSIIQPYNNPYYPYSNQFNICQEDKYYNTRCYTQSLQNIDYNSSYRDTYGMGYDNWL
jgi:hypothetical protein